MCLCDVGMPSKRKNRDEAEAEGTASIPQQVEQSNRGVPVVVNFNTLLEETRQYHDDIERLERLICDEFRGFHGGAAGPAGGKGAQGGQNKSAPRNTYNARLFHEYAVLDLLDQVKEKSAKLLAMYEDARGERAEEVAHGLKGEDALSTFYGYVKSIEAYFHDEETTLVEGYDEGCRRALKRVEPGVLEARVRGLFSGEEGLGRYFDVDEIYKEVWCGILEDFMSKQGKQQGGNDKDDKDGEKSKGALVVVKEGGVGAGGVSEEDTSFAAYLRRLEYGHQEDLTANYKMKNHGKYVPYLTQLVAYLSGLYTRANPLKEWSSVAKEIEEAFEAAWEGGLKGAWAAQVGVDAEDQEGWAQRYNTVDELEAGLGGEKIKMILASMGLKCGGTVRQRAERLWSVKGKAADEIDPSLFAGGRGKKGGKGGEAGNVGNANAVAGKTAVSNGRSSANNANGGAGTVAIGEDVTKSIARLEFTIKHLCTTPGLLAKQYKATIEKLEKRHAQTYEEFVADMEAELEDDVAENVFADEEEDEEVHNPLKIPLGFDGKPIPYWMYKLHGLNHEFTCEICGNTTYYGRRQFEKHFLEVKHVSGLKALGIPSSREFHEITSISEALGLWKTIQAKKKVKETVEEEVEDADGNIMSRAMLNQMQMQGLFK